MLKNSQRFKRGELFNIVAYNIYRKIYFIKNLHMYLFAFFRFKYGNIYLQM